MNDDCNDVKKYDFYDVPISHFECPLKDYEDSIRAANGAWSCLKDLALIFCLQYCYRECTIVKNIDHSHFDVSEKHEKKKTDHSDWYDVQKSFHQSLSYLQPFGDIIEDCPACTVTKAFACFPILAKHSKVKPVAMVINETNEDYDNPADIEEYSFPCYGVYEVVSGSFGGCEQKELTIRENALLNLDLNNIPALPPRELIVSMKHLRNGQSIVKYLYQKKNTKPLTIDRKIPQYNKTSTSIQKNENENNQPLTSIEKRELGQLKNEKIKWDSSIKAATIVGIFCGAHSQNKRITKDQLHDELKKHNLYRDLPDATFEKIWKAIPEKHRNLGGRPRKSE